MKDPTQSPGARYSTPAIVLHWAIAALIVTNFVIGLKYEGAHGLAKFDILQWHKSVGFTVLALSLARIAWRLLNPPAPYPAHMKRWEKAAAAGVHWGFYILMFALPLTGWVIISASLTNIPTLLYKTVPFPHIGYVHALPMATRHSVEDAVGEVHEWLAWTTAALFVLHVAAALKHQFFDRDPVLYRMAPFKGLGPRP